MDFTLDSGYLEVQERCRTLAATVAPLAAEADEWSTPHPAVIDALRESGLARLAVPGAYGGSGETVDAFAFCLAREVFMGTSSHLDTAFALQGIGSYAITVAGTPDQRDRWLPAVGRMEAVAALALTEPQTGSDLKGITTRAERSGSGFLLNGQKSFISNGGHADFYTVLAREEDGLSVFLVPGDLRGVTTTATPDLIAPHVLGELDFADVELPAGSRIGDPGRGMDYVLATLGVFRVSVAGAAVGLADAAVREAARHAATREQFGRPLVRLGPVAAMLADSWADVEMTRLLTYRAALAARDNPSAALNASSMAKLAATEAASRVVDRGVQIMGRYGLVRGSTMERLYRQARPMRIYEGASEVLRLGIARTLCDEVTAEAAP
jgi:acyl-CoA dehydrogenase